MKKLINKLISGSLTSKSNIPKELGKMIVYTSNELYDREKTKEIKPTYRNYYKILAGLCASVILTTGIVFAKDIDRYIKTLFNLSEHGIGEQQIESAISDNYIQYDSSKYIKSNDIYIIK